MTFATDVLGEPIEPGQAVITIQLDDWGYCVGRVVRITGLLHIVVVNVGGQEVFRQSKNCLVVTQSLLDISKSNTDQVIDFLYQPLKHGDWVLYLIDKFELKPKRFNDRTDSPIKSINMVSFPKFTVYLLKNG